MDNGMFILPSRCLFSKLASHLYIYPVYKCPIYFKAIKNKRYAHLKTILTILFLVDTFG